MNSEKKKTVLKNSNIKILKKGDEKKSDLPSISEEKSKLSNKEEEKKEWQLSLKDSKDRLTHLFQQKTNWDVKFTLVDDNQKSYEFPAHAFYLAACSPVFELLIKDAMKNLKSEIPLTNIPPRVFNKVLKYLYTDKINFANDEEVVLLCEAATNYRLPYLQTDCQEYLSNISLKVENVACFLNSAINHKNSHLRNKCLDFIGLNAQAVMEDKTKVKFVQEAVMDIINIPQMRIQSEEIVLKFVVDWAKYKTNTRDISPFLKHIRFDGMTARDFLYVYDRNQELFDERQSLEILRYMARPEYGLPPWCMVLDTKRKTARERDEEMKGPTIEISSEYRIFPKTSYVKNFSTHEISDNISVRCMQKTELVLGIKVEWIKLDGCCSDAKVLYEGYILEPRSSTPIQIKRITQQCQFGEDNFLILNFKSPFRMYYDCTLNLNVTLRFLTEVNLEVSEDYTAVSHIILENRKVEPDNRRCAIFSAMYYTPPMMKH